MKLIEAMKRVDRSKENSFWVDHDFYNALMARDVWLSKDAPRITGYHLAPWLCTDTWVGANVYYLDDRPLAYSFQSARKNGVDYAFVDKAVLHDAREYLSSLLDEAANIKFIDPEEEYVDRYRVSYREQILEDRGYVDDRAVIFNRAATRDWLEANRGKMSSYGYTFPGADQETYKESIIVVDYADDTQEAIDVSRFFLPVRIV